MSPDYRAFWTPRRGHSPEQYEDAFAVDVAAGRYAVADGATESSFARLWSDLLVEEFAHGAPYDPDQWPDRLAALQKRWHADVSSRSLSWYGEAGIAQGAFAAFLGITLKRSADESWRWQAIAVGDSCLFHTRDAELLSPFPLLESWQFNSVPDLLSSKMSLDELRQTKHLVENGSGRPNDRLWMMTDSISQWCLEADEERSNPWAEMESMLSGPEPEQQFAAWFEELRDNRGLHNDDVTLLVIDL